MGEILAWTANPALKFPSCTRPRGLPRQISRKKVAALGLGADGSGDSEVDGRLIFGFALFVSMRC